MQDGLQCTKENFVSKKVHYPAQGTSHAEAIQLPPYLKDNALYCIKIISPMMLMKYSGLKNT